MRRLAAALALTCALSPFAGGCNAVAPLSVIGDQCDLSSECQAPLICALGRCRTECEAARDCALGLRCIKLPQPATGGVCQLPEESSCTLDSECPPELRCFGDNGCLPECDADADCIAGESCNEPAMECIAPEVVLCTFDSTCGFPRVCSVQQECIFECVARVDCPTGEACVQHESCEGKCMCRIPCADDSECPLGTSCLTCAEGLDCTEAETAAGAGAGYCERPGAGTMEE